MFNVNRMKVNVGTIVTRYSAKIYLKTDLIMQSIRRDGDNGNKHILHLVVFLTSSKSLMCHRTKWYVNFCRSRFTSRTRRKRTSWYWFFFFRKTNRTCCFVSKQSMIFNSCSLMRCATIIYMQFTRARTVNTKSRPTEWNVLQYG